MYTTVTLNSSSTPALTYINSYLEPNMLTVGWVKVATNVAVNTANASSALIWNVYKSPGGNNSIAKDFYVAVGWDNASNANVAITTFEQFSNTGNTCLGYGPLYIKLGQLSSLSANGWPSSGFSTLPGDPASNVAYVITGSTASGDNYNNMASTISQTFYHSVTIDRIVSFSSNTQSWGTGHAFYAGVYDTFINPTIDQYPICVLNLKMPQAVVNYNVTIYNAYGFATREFFTTPPYSSNYWNTSLSNPLNSIGSSTELYSNRNLFSRVLIAGNSGGLRGLCKDIYFSGAGGNVGDTASLSINGVVYTATLIRTNVAYSGFYAWVLQV
jgi:hypothetical protein